MSDDTTAQAAAAARPVPTLQPMKIVQVAETAIPMSAIATSRNAPTGNKKAVMSKKEHEAVTAAKIKEKVRKVVLPASTEPPADFIPPTNEERNMSKEELSQEVLNEFPQEWADLGYTRVYRAWVQTPISISGKVSSETTFTPGMKFQDLVMAKDKEVLWIRCKGIEFFTPLANVKCGITKEES